MKQPTDFYKAAAYRASEFLLKKRKLKMKHSEALELIATVFNQPNWQTLNAIGQNEIDPDLLNEKSENSITTSIESSTDHVSLLPFSRPASPWKQGSSLFIDPEGNLVPYVPNSTSETIETDPLALLEARLQMEFETHPRYQQWQEEDERIRNSPEILKLRKKRKELVHQLNQQAIEMLKARKNKEE